MAVAGDELWARRQALFDQLICQMLDEDEPEDEAR
jgi:hypothetical protein